MEVDECKRAEGYHNKWNALVIGVAEIEDKVRDNHMSGLEFCNRDQ